MLARKHGYLRHRGSGPAASHQLEELGYVVLRRVFGRTEIAELRRELEYLYDTEVPPPRHELFAGRDYREWRHATLNRSPAAQRAVAQPRLLSTIEPLLGEDCHVIANTTWRNDPRDPKNVAGGPWHMDAGPHVPRPEGVEWDDRIPYPVFAIGVHILIDDCDLASGPTGVLARSHRSGRTPPPDRMLDDSLTYEGRGPVPLTGESGDVAMFVSDAWHRRLPQLPGDRGRFFLQVHYGRRDIAQRINQTHVTNHLSPEAIARARAGSARDQTLVGLHLPAFYDG